MFAEVNDLKALIIAPPHGDQSEPASWEWVLKLYDSVFVVDHRRLNSWSRWARNNRALVVSQQEKFVNSIAASIKESLEHLDIQPFQAAYVAFDPGDLPEAVNTRVGTILVGTPQGRALPDIIVNDVDNLKKSLEVLRRGETHGFWGEVVSSRRPGSGFYMSLPWPPDHEGIAAKANVYILGRYFAEADARHLGHPLTARILKLKREHDTTCIDILAPVLRSINEKTPIGILTRVPPRPSKKADPLGELLVAASQSIDKSLANRCSLTALRCIRDFPPQKTIGGSRIRIENVKGAFEAGNIQEAHVLILDDILTTGGTLAECVRVVGDAGASRVTVLTLGYTQRVIETQPRGLICVACEGTMRVRLNKRTGEPFWGCQRYPECKSTLSWATGRTNLNGLNTRDNIDIEYDLPF